MKLDYAALSDTGQVRENNEDFYGAVIPDAPGAQMSCDALFVVADGMGGHRGGEIASKLAVETIIESYHSSEHADKADLLREALTSANRAIVDSSVADTALFGMGTTCTAMMISDDTAYFGHVGDSRAYRVRAGEIKQDFRRPFARRGNGQVRYHFRRGRPQPPQTKCDHAVVGKPGKRPRGHAGNANDTSCWRHVCIVLGRFDIMRVGCRNYVSCEGRAIPRQRVAN